MDSPARLRPLRRAIRHWQVPRLVTILPMDIPTTGHRRHLSIHIHTVHLSDMPIPTHHRHIIHNNIPQLLHLTPVQQTILQCLQPMSYPLVMDSSLDRVK